MIRKIALLGDANFGYQVLDQWFATLPEDTVVLPLMRDGATVAKLRMLARKANISVMLSMSPQQKWDIATEVVVLGLREFGAQERAIGSGLPWALVSEEDDGDDEPPWEQLSLM